jgi:hypothetical protein
MLALLRGRSAAAGHIKRKMFGLAAWNRLLRKQQDEKVVLSAHDVLGQKQISEQKDNSLMYRVLPRHAVHYTPAAAHQRNLWPSKFAEPQEIKQP